MSWSTSSPIVCRRSGERVHGGLRGRAGGSAVNAALVARAIGADTQIVGRAGGDLVVATLEQSGIEVQLARDDELPPGVAVALRDAVVTERGVNARLSPDTFRRRCGEMSSLFTGCFEWAGQGSDLRPWD